MGQNLSSIEQKIQILFAELVDKLGYYKYDETSVLTNEYWLLFTQKKLRAVQMSNIFASLDSIQARNPQYLECRDIIKKITKLLIGYEYASPQI